MNNEPDKNEPEYYKNKIPPSYTTGKLDLDASSEVDVDAGIINLN